MALTKNIYTKYGMTVNNAYIRVEKMSFSGKDQLEFRVRVYADASKPFVEDKGIAAPYDLNGANPFAQAYAHLKTMPAYMGAADC
jgi:hypothetical protein